MSQAVVRKILEREAKSWADGKGYPIVFENDGVTPETFPHARCFLLPAPTRALDLAGDIRTFSGVFQVSVIVERGKGLGQAEAILEELAGVYPLFQRFNDNGVTVLIRTPVTAGIPIQESHQLTLPVSFQYRADID